MIVETGLRWIVTLAFAAAGAFCLYRCLRHGSAAHRVCDVLHALMCAGMVAMAWPAAMTVARVPQIVLFAVAAVWFAGMLVIGRRNRLSLGVHALMMAGMAWMVLVMPWAMAGTPTSAPAAASGDHAGMAMGGTVTMLGDAPAHVTIVAVVLALVFLVAGTGWLARAIDTGRGDRRLRLPTAGLAVNGVMSLGMALMATLLI